MSKPVCYRLLEMPPKYVVSVIYDDACAAKVIAPIARWYGNREPLLPTQEEVSKHQIDLLETTPGHAAFFGAGAPWIVREDVKEMIDGFEPGVHEFLKINHVRARGSFYFLVVKQQIEAVRRDSIEFSQIPDGSPLRRNSRRIMPYAELKVDAAALLKRHLWLETAPIQNSVFLSAEFYMEMKARDLHRALDVRPCHAG